MESYYYAPDALLNKFVYVTDENQREVIDFFSQFNLAKNPMFTIHCYYGIDKNRFVVGRVYPTTDIEIIVSLTYLKSLWLRYKHQPKPASNDDKSKEFPRLMLVSNTGNDWCVRAVIFYGYNRYWSLAAGSTVKDFLNSELMIARSFTPSKYAKDLPQEAPKVELTLQQIAEKFNIPVDKLRIKDK